MYRKSIVLIALLCFCKFSFAQIFTKEALQARIEQSKLFGDSINIPVYSSEVFGFKNEGLYFLKKNDKWALINKNKDKTIIPYEIDSIFTLFNFPNIKSYLIKRKEQWESITFDKKYKIKKSEPESGLAQKKLGSGMLEMYNKPWRRFEIIFNGKRGIMNKEFKIIIPVKYDYVLDLQGTIFEKDKDSLSYLVYNDNKVGIVNNAIQIEPEFQDVGLKFPTYFPEEFGEHKLMYDKDYFGFKLDGKYGIMNYQQEIIVPNIYSQIVYCKSYADESASQGKFIVKTKEGISLINAKNKTLIPIGYHSIEYKSTSSKQDLFIVSKANRYGIVNSQNKIIKPIEFTIREMRSY